MTNTTIDFLTNTSIYYTLIFLFCGFLGSIKDIYYALHSILRACSHDRKTNLLIDKLCENESIIYLTVHLEAKTLTSGL